MHFSVVKHRKNSLKFDYIFNGIVSQYRMLILVGRNPNNILIRPNQIRDEYLLLFNSIDSIYTRF